MSPPFSLKRARIISLFSFAFLGASWLLTYVFRAVIPAAICLGVSVVLLGYMIVSIARSDRL